MKKFIISSAFLLLLGGVCFSQEETNGTIYIKHPYIGLVNKSAQAYLDKDWNTEKTLYADTAKWWISGLEKKMPIADAIKSWATDFDYFDNIKQVVFPGSYPDYLHYKKDDVKVVQSWWVWSGKSKKTGEVVTVTMVQFDEFNKAGKITSEEIYGDFSKVEAAKHQ